MSEPEAVQAESGIESLSVAGRKHLRIVDDSDTNNQAVSRSSLRTQLLWALVVFLGLAAGFFLEIRALGIDRAIGGSPVLPFTCFILLLAVLWFFAFGAADLICALLRGSVARIATPALLAIPYLIFAVPRGEIRWGVALAVAALPVALAALLEFSRQEQTLIWQDIVVLLTLALALELRVFSAAWPQPGLGSLPKLYLADVALYLYMIVRPLRGMGYSFVPRWSAFSTGLREWLYFLPIAIGVGFALHFIGFFPRVHSIGHIAAGILVTFLLTAVPEEIFFRGILQNLLESRIGQQRALIVASLLFGLSHFPKGAIFNWRYVILASIAGIFYGRAWRRNRQLLASSTTHTAVDVVWSLWFR